MFNIGNANNKRNTGLSKKEHFTWRFLNTAGIRVYLWLPFNPSSHLFYLLDLRESQTYMDSRAEWG